MTTIPREMLLFMRNNAHLTDDYKCLWSVCWPHPLNANHQSPDPDSVPIQADWNLDFQPPNSA